MVFQAQDDTNMELGGWRLVELLGRGGMGEVWRAEREGPGGIKRRAAVKRILSRFRNDPEVRARFVSEARINTRLEHPNVVSVIDFGEKPEPFLVFEFVSGISAADLLQEASKMRLKIPAAAAAFICAEAATALDYAHRKRDEDGQPLKIVHRDVSPHNLLLSIEGAVKLGDFGVAHAVDNQFQTAAGVQIGKLVYMSPEQALGQDVDGRADIFSLGIVLWELLTLKPCLPRDDTAEALRRIQHGLIAPPSTLEPQIPATLDAIVMSAVSPQREQRFATAGAFAQALRSFVHSVAPGFDSGELMRICQRLAPSVSWHTPTGSMPALNLKAELQAVANGQAGVAAPGPFPASAAPAPARAGQGRQEMPAMNMPQGQAQAQQAQQAQQQAQPSSVPLKHIPLSQSQPFPNNAMAPGAAQGGGFSVAAPKGPFPSAAPMGSATASPSFGQANFGNQPSFHLPIKRTPIVVWIALALGVLLGVGAVIGFIVQSKRGAASTEEPTTTQQPGTPGSVPQQQTNSEIPQQPPTPGGNPTVVPLDPPPDVANAGEPSETMPTVEPSDAGAPRDTSNQRAISEIQRQLASSRDEFRTCVSVPAGARARITLMVDFDASLQRVSLVQASSSNGTLTLTEQQCLKGIAQRAVHPSNVTAPVRTRWSMWIESTTNFERQ